MPTIRPLIPSNDAIVSQAVELFGEGIVRSKNWNHTTAQEARAWVDDEFRHPQALLLGAFEDELLIGVCCTVPLWVVLPSLASDLQRQSLLNAIKGRSGEVDLEKMLHWGGLAIHHGFERQGVGPMLADAALQNSQGHFPNATLTVAQTRSPIAEKIAINCGYIPLLKVRKKHWLIRLHS